MLFRLLGNAFVSKKIESRNVYSYPPGQNSPPGSYHHPPGREKLLIPPTRRFFIFLKICPLSRILSFIIFPFSNTSSHLQKYTLCSAMDALVELFDKSWKRYIQNGSTPDFFSGTFQKIFSTSIFRKSLNGSFYMASM